MEAVAETSIKTAIWSTGMITVRAALLAILVHATVVTAQADSTSQLRVTFLGTSGGPVPGAERAGSASLVEYGSEAILIDAGRGAVQQMQRLNLNPGIVTQVFLTHLHSDHTVALPEVWLARWTCARFKPAVDSKLIDEVFFHFHQRHAAA